MRQVPVDDLDDTPYSKWPDKAFREEFGQTKKQMAKQHRKDLLDILNDDWLYPSRDLTRRFCPVAQDAFGGWRQLEEYHAHLDEVADTWTHRDVRRELEEQLKKRQLFADPRLLLA